MASVNITLTVPDKTVPLIRRTLGGLLGEDAPTDAAGTKLALETYFTAHLKDRARDQKRFEQEAIAAGDDTDGLADW